MDQHAYRRIVIPRCSVLGKRTGILAVIVCLLFLSGVGCSKSEVLTTRRAEELAKSYFMEQYQIDVQFCEIDRMQIMEHTYLTRIIVSCEGSDYELVLDQNNRPLSDSVSCCRIVEALQDEDFLQQFLDDVMAEVKLSKFWVLFSSQEMRYVVILSVDVQAPVAREKEAEVYTLLTELKERDVFALAIGVVTPDFLLPVEGGAGVELAGAYFYTDMEQDAFQAQYLSFAKSIRWDEDLFRKKLTELESSGVQDARFYIRGWSTGTVLEIALSYVEQSDHTPPLEDLISDVDDRYFSIEGKDVQYISYHPDLKRGAEAF